MNASPNNTDRLSLLETFVRIVEAGSISAAATQLDSTPPTISRRLQALERELGLQLLARSSRSMTLTEDGERCYQRAKSLLAEWAEFESDVRGEDDEPRGNLRVVVPHAFGQAKLVDALGDFLERYPGISIEWTLHDRTPDFVANKVDCAIHAGEVTTESAVAVLLAEVPRIVAASPRLLGKQLPMHANELANLPWIGQHPYSRDRVELREAESSEAVEVRFRPRVITDNLFALRSAALRGLGVCVASEWVLREDIDRGDLVHIAPTWQAAPLPLWLVYPRLQHTPARVRHFLAAMRAAVPVALSGEVLRKRGRDGGR
ncbi:LysR family transcriptional regulator [Roseateles agri]|nr:LysR substrate-binding domain-containing protein [Paucibacter sp. R3-3]